MIDVLIVDDDNLVRKGLISTMPWAAFGMRVAGEAANGEKALEFLAANRVQLLLTDLAMPVMSGIELIRIVRKQYPDIAVAVLTLHQDFEYIQEALRLGAVDYIAKVQLEIEHFEEVFGRIRARILEEQGKRPSSEGHHAPASDVCRTDTVYALVALREPSEAAGQAQDPAGPKGWRTAGDGSVRLWMPDASGDPSAASDRLRDGPPLLPGDVRQADWRTVKLRNAAGESLSDLLQGLAEYRRHEFFYDCDGSESDPIDKSVRELRTERPAAGEGDAESAKEALHAFQWLHHDRDFEALRDRLRGLRLPIPKLMQLLYGCTVDWNRLYRAVAQAGVALPDRFGCWREVAEWLESFRETALSVSGRLQLSGEVSGSIMAAVKIIHDELEHPLFAVEVAKRVNLSRSYFNQCFKEIVGHSFNEYLRKVRIDKAREFLVQTNKPIQWVAEYSGYADEKYFSRVFREQAGMLPSEYRQRYRQG